MRIWNLNVVLLVLCFAGAIPASTTVATADRIVVQKVCKQWYTRRYFCCGSGENPCRKMCFQDVPKYECRMVRSRIPDRKVDTGGKDPKAGHSQPRPPSGGLLDTSKPTFPPPKAAPAGKVVPN